MRSKSSSLGVIFSKKNLRQLFPIRNVTTEFNFVIVHKIFNKASFYLRFYYWKLCSFSLTFKFVSCVNKLVFYCMESHCSGVKRKNHKKSLKMWHILMPVIR